LLNSLCIPSVTLITPSKSVMNIPSPMSSLHVRTALLIV
jgi:hypothetical protein